jgi:hypothetical protein
MNSLLSLSLLGSSVQRAEAQDAMNANLLVLISYHSGPSFVVAEGKKRQFAG